MLTQSLTGIKILGCGSFLPGEPVGNDKVASRCGSDSEWVERRTGIKSRHYASADQATSDLAIEAAKQAIANSGVAKEDIGLVIVGTFTPDYWCPSTASIVQHKLGIEAAAFDLQAACAGFIYSLTTGGQFIASGNVKYALIIGADCVSRAAPTNDPQLTPLFGDGAGAVVIGKGSQDEGLEVYQLGSDGSGLDMLLQPVGGTRTPMSAAALANGDHLLHMDGKKVFKWAVNILSESIAHILNQRSLTISDVDRYFFHQANQRILDAAISNLGIPSEKVHSTLSYSGNTSAASVPICLHEAFSKGLVSPGDRVVTSGFGAGLTWGSALLRI